MWVKNGVHLLPDSNRARKSPEKELRQMHAVWATAHGGEFSELSPACDMDGKAQVLRRWAGVRLES